MSLRIEPYLPEHIPAVIDFNRRLAAGGVAEGFRFPEFPRSAWLPRDSPSQRLYEELFVAVEEGAVRGGYILKHQDFRMNGTDNPIGYFHLPLSEGLVDRRYTSVGIRLLRDAIDRCPSLYCLGMGGEDRPLPRMLRASGWSVSQVPFFFRVVNSRRFFSELRVLQNPPWRALAARMAAVTGTGGLAMGAIQKFRTHSLRDPGDTRCVLESGTWEDDLWSKAADEYSLAAIRDSTVLNRLYNNPRFHKILVTAREGTPAGWAVALDTQMHDDAYFGNLRLGTIIDNLAVRGAERQVIRAVRRLLVQRGVDLIVSNQSHASWIHAMRSEGFLSGPSNFILAASKQLTAAVPDRQRMHFLRGDGDGPIHL